MVDVEAIADFSAALRLYMADEGVSLGAGVSLGTGVSLLPLAVPFPSGRGSSFPEK